MKSTPFCNLIIVGNGDIASASTLGLCEKHCVCHSFYYSKPA